MYHTTARRRAQGPAEQAHESFAQLACEAAGAIRTVASLAFFVIALMFWYDSILVADLKRTTFQFFIGLMSTTIQANNVFSFVLDISSAEVRGVGCD